jgi:hypothetical protein
MKKISIVFLFLIAPLTFSQFQDRFETLNETNIKAYATPFATSFGLAMNSGSFYKADVPSLFGFSIGFRGMYLLIPESQKTFTPVLPEYYNPKEVATIWGDKGGAFAGPNGYEVTQPGFNRSAVPFALPQITLSFMGTEAMFRILPEVTISGDDKVSMYGFGIKHEISRYFPLMPLDVAVQVLYNKFEISSLMNATNFAVNAHASKTFAVVTPYVGLQYESSSMDLKYDYRPGLDPNAAVVRTIAVSLDGDNSFRGIIGAALELGFLVFNADVAFSSQTVLTGGLTFAF